MKATTYRAVLKSMVGSQFMYGCPKSDEKQGDETHEQFEQRTWQQKIRANKDGIVVLNSFAVKNALESAAGRIRKGVPGQRGSEFKKLFVQGIMIGSQPVMTAPNGTPYTKSDFYANPLFVPSTGKRGAGTRVFRIFPTVDQWQCEIDIIVLDPKITEEVLREHLVEAGVFIGLGSMRVEGGGVNGRFTVESICVS